MPESHWRDWGLWALAAYSPCLCSANKHCSFLHHHPVSVDWLCCVSGEWNQVWFGNNFSDHKRTTVLSRDLAYGNWPLASGGSQVLSRRCTSTFFSWTVPSACCHQTSLAHDAFDFVVKETKHLLVEMPHRHWHQGIFLLATWLCLWWGIDFSGIIPYCTKQSVTLRDLLVFACLLDIWQHQPWTTKNGYSELFSIL